ncbi:MAG: NAD(P)/FAD-dependent oxidoreductase [Actinomycetota bacterium]|nr:NAD(P)/FAD-dependent oxidoreductase [Actinomycetota bacterium]
MTAFRPDVTVVGAGPAGVTAAITLTRAGRRVCLIDRATFPRDKCCGDGLTTNALRRLYALGLDPVTVPSWQPITETWIRSPDGRTGSLPFRPGGSVQAAAARRYDLDAALVDLARSYGIDVREGTGVAGARLEEDGRTVGLDLSDGSALRSPYVVAADGMWSPMRKLTGADDPRGYLGDWHAIRQYFTDTGPSATKMWVWFDSDILPGYAWSFPLPSGGANVGFGIIRRPGEATGSMKARWADLLSRPHIASVLGPNARPEQPFKAWPIPTRIGHSSLSALGGRVHFVGDAARSGDPLTGEGIGQAMESAEMAVHSLIQAGADRPDRAAMAYRRAIDATLGVDDKVSVAVSNLLRRPRVANGWQRLVMANKVTRYQFLRWMFEDYPRALVLTPRRWAVGPVRPDRRQPRPPAPSGRAAVAEVARASLAR